MPRPCDSLIFDMDGTLWDAVDSYCLCWDETASRLGIRRAPVKRTELIPLMGKPLEEIFQVIIGGSEDLCRRFMIALGPVECEIMPRLGGRLYPGVRETLTKLSAQGVRLFMVSNCTEHGLDNFLNFTALRMLFTDWRSFGATGVDKDVNLIDLRNCYNLQRPMYVGDIQRDCDSTHAAGMEFVWASYGFGRVGDAEFVIDSFPRLEEIVENTRGQR